MGFKSEWPLAFGSIFENPSYKEMRLSGTNIKLIE